MKPAVFLLFLLAAPIAADDTAWPSPTRDAKPWTRWWWPGSAVDTGNLSREIEAFAQAGFGGVEVHCIHGSKDPENRRLSFLSAPWIAAWSHTVRHAARNRMGVDLVTGTGLSFGGSAVDASTAAASLASIVAETEGGREFVLDLPPGTLEVLSAWPDSGEPVDLLSHARDKRLRWQVPAGSWRIHGLVSSPAGDVKLAAPGGQGPILDPFSKSAIDAYLAPFSTALDKPGIPEPRAHSHGPFEYERAAWTRDLFTRFQHFHGYDLRSQLPLFHGRGDPGQVARVRADYRETMGLLHREFLAQWQTWARKRGSLARNQAHGSPGNLLDHYAAADIPETALFRQAEDAQIPMLRFAASAARLGGKHLIAAEAFSSFGEPFRITPAQIKEAADFLWLGGANHLFFHGIPYSPPDAGWPGWLPLTPAHMGPNGGLWKNLPAFNTYVARCQTFLQAGEPDSELLLYYPVHDAWHDGAEGLPLFSLHNQHQWLHGTPFHRAAMTFWQAGIPCEFISDSFLSGAMVEGGRIRLGKQSYHALVIPDTRLLPDSTAWQISRIAKDGGKVIFLGRLPADVPGFNNVGERRQSLAELLAGFTAETGDPAEATAKAGIAVDADLSRLGIRFIRRKLADGHVWFLVNRSGQTVDATVALSRPFASAVLMDPWSGRSGVAATENGLRLFLAPGESRILRTFAEKQAQGPAWTDPEPAGDLIPLAGIWKVTFIEGGPILPEPYETPTFSSWTERDGEAYRHFSGTALYRLEFDLEKDFPALLDLGDIAHTARVRLNGKDAGTCWVPPHCFDVRGLLQSGKNLLEIEVTSLAANRIAGLDPDKAPWKDDPVFLDAGGKPFDPSAWPPLPSGLLGPVILLPLKP